MTRNGIIIGGGASGLTAAITAAEHGSQVTIIEHSAKLGKKILSTGNGKCNLTNLFLDASCYRSDEEAFPMKVLQSFGPEQTVKFFRKLGVLTTDRNGYVYPMSGQARTISDALIDRARELGVRVMKETEVVSISSEKGIFRVKTTGEEVKGDYIILACGSKAAKSTGSDGSGYKLAESLGHTLVKPVPALVQLRCKGNYFPEISGVRIQATVGIFQGKHFLASDTGELQLTDYGISGIPVFQVSRYASKLLDRKKPVTAVVDFFPETSEHEFFSLLQEQKKLLKERKAAGFLTGLFNKKLADFFLKAAQISPTLPIKDLSKHQISDLCRVVKSFEIAVNATNSFEQAQICAGGVKTTEVNPNTMESKKVKGLYIVGELLDVDGICGGYNLQWAWATGYLAGLRAAQN